MFGDGEARVVALGWKKEPLGEIPNGRTRLIVASLRTFLGRGTQYRHPNTLWMLLSQDGEALVLPVAHRQMRMAPARLYAQGTIGAQMWARIFAWAKPLADSGERRDRLSTHAWPTGRWAKLLAPKAIRALAHLLPPAQALAEQGVPGATDRWEPEHLGHWMGGDSTRPIDSVCIDPCIEAMATVATLLPPRFAQATIELRAGTLNPDGTGNAPTLRFLLHASARYSHPDLDRVFASLLDGRTLRGVVRGGGAACAPATIPTTILGMGKPYPTGPRLLALEQPIGASSAHVRLARTAKAQDQALRVLGGLPDPSHFVRHPT